MNRDETLRLALKAGIDVAFGAAVDRFAAVIAAAEREACAKACEEDGLLLGKKYAAVIRARGER